MSRKTSTNHEHDERQDERPSSPQEAEPSDAASGAGDQPIEMTEEAAKLVERIEAERDEALAAKQRALADFANYQRRMAESERRAARNGEANVVRSILPVLDHFDLALNQDRTQVSIDQLLGGVEMVRDELRRALEQHGVQRIEPAIGDPFDPNRHDAMQQQPAENVEPNHVSAVHQTGYALGEMVLRPAKVAVAPPDDQE